MNGYARCTETGHRRDRMVSGEWLYAGKFDIISQNDDALLVAKYYYCACSGHSCSGVFYKKSPEVVQTDAIDASTEL